MTQRNNTRFKVVFLIALVFSLISACTLPPATNRDHRPSSPNQNGDLDPNFDRIEASLRSNEDNEERQPQATTTSLPTHNETKTHWPTKTQALIISITKIPSSTNFLSLTAMLGGFYVSFPHELRNASCVRTWERLVAVLFRSTMELRLIFENDNRTNTIRTFVPYDSAAI